jgi:uroporphyrinogen decarboxylase
MSELSSRERVLMALRHERPDRVPFNFWMDRRLMDQYIEEMGHYFRVDRYGADVIETFPLLPWPSGEGMMRDGTMWVTKHLWEDEWGGAASLNWPDPHDPKYYEIIENDVKNKPDKALFVNIAGITTLMHGIRAEQDLYMDFYDRPDDVLEVFDKFGEIMAETVRVVCEKFPEIAAIYVQDDLCAKNGPVFSPDMLEKFIYFVNDRPIRAAREAGKPVVYHSDGKTEAVTEHLIELGVSAINPLQPHLNDFDQFKEQFGGRMAVYGALDNCFIIPDGTPEEVRRHVLDSFEKLGKDGGLILSTHDIPLHCPRENVEMMVKTITEECVY